MKRLTFRLTIALLTFAIGITAAWLWIIKPSFISDISDRKTSSECIPIFDPNIHPALLKEKADANLFLAFREMPLGSLPSCVDESYRLIWIPTFHAPVVVRVWRAGEKYFMVAKQLDGRGGYGIGNLSVEQTRSLTDDERMDFVTRLNQAGFWELPFSVDEPLPNDGAVWVMEGIRNKQYHSVKRFNPQGQYADLIKYLIKLSRLKTEHDKYLPRSAAGQLIRPERE